ncbi:hypothetical protein B7767_26905, partial [Streptomyces sp. 13-12-16]
ALRALPRLGAGTEVVDAVEAYRDRYVARGRCPADDSLDELRATARGTRPRPTHPHGKDTPS